MIVYHGPGDLLAWPAETITCPINVVGAMGRGLALDMKRKIPGLFDFYYKAYCEEAPTSWEERLRILRVFEVEGTRNKVLLFPTKKHWRRKSELAWIDTNLAYLAEHYKALGINSLALPQLGCGQGGLQFKDVKDCIYRHLHSIPLPVHLIID